MSFPEAAAGKFDIYHLPYCNPDPVVCLKCQEDVAHGSPHGHLLSHHRHLFREYLTSVWCFFAALISVVIYWIIADRQIPAFKRHAP